MTDTTDKTAQDGSNSPGGNSRQDSVYPSNGVYRSNGNDERDWTARQKLDVVIEGLKAENSVAEICEKHSLDEATYQQWHDVVLETCEEALNYGLGTRYKKKAGTFRFPTLLILLAVFLLICFTAFQFYYQHRM